MLHEHLSQLAAYTPYSMSFYSLTKLVITCFFFKLQNKTKLCSYMNAIKLQTVNGMVGEYIAGVFYFTHIYTIVHAGSSIIFSILIWPHSRSHSHSVPNQTHNHRVQPHPCALLYDTLNQKKSIILNINPQVSYSNGQRCYLISSSFSI